MRRAALVLALALALAPAGMPAARAQAAETSPDGVLKATSYFGCAMGLAMARTLPAAYGALVLCVHLFIEEKP